MKTPDEKSPGEETPDGQGERPSTWRDGLLQEGAEPVVRLLAWDGPWEADDPDANLKVDIVAYRHADPMLTLTGLARSIDVPVGALVRYVLARWASGGSEGLLELGPSTVERMRAEVEQAEAAGTDDARLAAYEVLRQQLVWLDHGLSDPERTYPAGGAARPRRT